MPDPLSQILATHPQFCDDADAVRAAEPTVLTAYLIDGVVVLDRGYADAGAAKADMGERAANPEDPNPLPRLWIDLVESRPAFREIVYSPVWGMSLDGHYPFAMPGAELAFELRDY